MFGPETGGMPGSVVNPDKFNGEEITYHYIVGLNLVQDDVVCPYSK